MQKPYISRIFIYPIKSLDPMEVESVKIIKKGSLEHDREFAFFDEGGKIVNAKKEKKFHLIRSFVDFENEIFKFKYKNEMWQFSFSEINKVNEFFSEIFGYKVFLKRNKEGGFPDDRKAHGPTIVSNTTLRTVANWFDISEDEVRKRFRANIEIEHVPSFWEDSLVGKTFKIGGVVVEGVNVSKRCPVPARNPETGEFTKNFSKKFIEFRKKSLPEFSPREVFKDTFYRLCLNTNIPATEWGKEIRIGEEVKV
ncbi:MAG TPA: MOSC domain-containing protein [Aquificaceae bacterium]|nr:MOSC domain-containing protein [Aquificaceae bacterium]